MKKVNLYMAFMNKMLKSNKKKKIYAKYNFLLSLKSVWNDETTDFKYNLKGVVFNQHFELRIGQLT